MRESNICVVIAVVVGFSIVNQQRMDVKVHAAYSEICIGCLDTRRPQESAESTLLLLQEIDVRACQEDMSYFVRNHPTTDDPC